MNASLKKKWVQALRSGRYVQGSIALRRNLSDGPEYCALGVLLDVWSPFEGDWNTTAPCTLPAFLWRGTRSQYGLAPEILIELGMTKKFYDNIVQMNGDCSFDEIADFIEGVKKPATPVVRMLRSDDEKAELTIKMLHGIHA